MEAQKVIYNINSFNYNCINDYPLEPKPKGNPHGRKTKRAYKSCVCAFDIETTNFDDIEQAVMYIWQFQIEDHTIIGRSWKSFFEFLTRLKNHLRENEWIVIYVHNLSYEFHFLSGLYDFQNDEVFATDSHTVLKCTMFDCFEFRCSYLHSNMSLDKFLKKMDVQDLKLKYDYSKIRYPWTKLTNKELQYCINDVKGLVEALKKEMRLDGGDTLYTIPLTSTGYPRRDTKKAMERFNHKQLVDMLPDAYVIMMLHEAFRGGDTHGSRYYAGDIIELVNSVDEVSAYLYVICNKPGPMSAFEDISKYCTFDDLTEKLANYKYALLMRVKFENIHLEDIMNGSPYLSTDKCRNIINGKYFNGRIISADSLETTITDIDMRIILHDYEFSNCEPYEIYQAKYGMLPQMIRDVVIDYFKKKTTLKGVDDYMYARSKEKLNAIYGMMAQFPGKQSIDYNAGEFEMQDKPLEEILNKNYKKAFLNYAWGVWVTAWSRYALREGIWNVGDGYIYSDTDSVKYIELDKKISFDEINEKRKEESRSNGAYAVDSNGEVHFMGVFEHDATYDQFVHLGAKRYAYSIDGKIGVTVSGVNKSKDPDKPDGGRELAAHGGLEAFKDGFIFNEAGGTRAVYNEINKPYSINIDGHKLEITSNVYITRTTYELGLTGEFMRMLEHIQPLKYSDRYMPVLYESGSVHPVIHKKKTKNI